MYQRTKGLCSRSVLVNIRNRKPLKKESSECIKARLERMPPRQNRSKAQLEPKASVVGVF
jgi:hypothetical protein